MTTRTWTPGTDVEADNPKNWSPTGAPQPGDQLTVNGSATMNISGNALAGDTLSLKGFDVSDNLTVFGDAHFSWKNGFTFGDDTNVNLADNSKWIGGFSSGPESHVLISGGGLFQNTTTYANGTVVVDADVRGPGTFNVDASHGPGVTAFLGVVGAAQTVNVSGYAEQTDPAVLQIYDPGDYHANTHLGFGQIVLEGMEAHSYSLKGDMLRLYNHGQVVDQMRLDVGTVNGFAGGGFGVNLTSRGVVIHNDGAAFKGGGQHLPVHS